MKKLIIFIIGLFLGFVAGAFVPPADVELKDAGVVGFTGRR